MTTFMKERLEEGATIDFFEPLKTLDLKTFSNLRKSVKVGGVKGRMVHLKIDQDLFGRMHMMQHRNGHPKEVFKCP